jgi:hypothetical protein
MGTVALPKPVKNAQFEILNGAAGGNGRWPRRFKPANLQEDDNSMSGKGNA